MLTTPNSSLYLLPTYTFTMRQSWIIGVSGLLIVAGSFICLSGELGSHLRDLRLADEGTIKQYKLPAQAQAWCQPSKFPPLNYHKCNPDDTVMEIPFMAGLTNGLKMMLLMVTKAFEENKCFYVTEKNNHLLKRSDKSQEMRSFIKRYFEPIGLDEDDVIVLKARKEGRIERARWQDAWSNAEKRRISGLYHNITSLGYEHIESTMLKRIMLQRMWRLLPEVRAKACDALESHGLQEEYLAFSVRRGDKNTEGFTFSKPEEYIEATEPIVKRHYDGIMPKIFVATDDCAVMDELRALKPTWTFSSECDSIPNVRGHAGFILKHMKAWTLEETDEHFEKFFVELIGLAGAKFYIGVTYTNVAWWATYMRPHRWSHMFLDTPKGNSVYKTLDAW